MGSKQTALVALPELVRDKGTVLTAASIVPVIAGYPLLKALISRRSEGRLALADVSVTQQDLQALGPANLLGQSHGQSIDRGQILWACGHEAHHQLQQLLRVEDKRLAPCTIGQCDKKRWRLQPHAMITEREGLDVLGAGVFLL